MRCWWVILLCVGCGRAPAPVVPTPPAVEPERPTAATTRPEYYDTRPVVEPAPKPVVHDKKWERAHAECERYRIALPRHEAHLVTEKAANDAIYATCKPVKRIETDIAPNGSRTHWVSPGGPTMLECNGHFTDATQTAGYSNAVDLVRKTEKRIKACDEAGL